MNVEYDREEDILTIEISRAGKIDHAEQAGSFIAHFNPEGKLVLLEILDASEFLTSLIKVSLRGGGQHLSLPTGEAV